MKIGNIIKTLRKSKSIKQKDLASKLQISNAYLSSIENDRKEPSLDVIKGISEFLDVPVGYFFLESYDVSQLSGKRKKVFSELKKLFAEFLKLQGAKHE